MKMPFRGDPSAALDKTRRKLADVEANIAGLKAKRAELLATADADNIGEIQTINKAIEVEESAKAIYVAKVAALREECRKVTYAEREGQRAKSITKIKERLRRREALAANLQTAIEAVGRLYVQLTMPDEIEAEWSFKKPSYGFAAIDRRGVDREIGWTLHGLCREHRLPEPNSIGLGVIGITAQGIDGIVRQQNEAIVSRLETVALHDDLLEESA